MRAYRGLAALSVVAALALPASPAFAQQKVLSPAVPFPWWESWRFHPDLVIDAVTASLVKCQSPKATLSISVTLRNAGWKPAYLQYTRGGYGPWLRMQDAGAWTPQEIYFGYFTSLAAGQTKTLQKSLALNYSSFGPGLSAGVRVYADPNNQVTTELNKLNNYAEKWFTFSSCP